MGSIKASIADGILVATYWRQSVIYLLTQNLLLSQNKSVILKKSEIICMTSRQGQNGKPTALSHKDIKIYCYTGNVEEDTSSESGNIPSTQWPIFKIFARKHESLLWDASRNKQTKDSGTFKSLALCQQLKE